MKTKVTGKRRFPRAAVLIAAVLLSGGSLLFMGSCSKAWADIEAPGGGPSPTLPVNAAVQSAGAPAFPRDNAVIEIKDRMFISQVNDVYVNTGDYLGKTVKVEGIFKQELYAGEEAPYCFVIRYGPGCCGYDGNVGFEIAWAEEKPYPGVDSWVEATGVVKTYEANEGFQYVYLDLVSLDVLSTRGVETVNQ